MNKLKKLGFKKVPGTEPGFHMYELTPATLCWDCHYQKHHGKDGWFDRDKEIQALIKANLHPEATNWNPFEVEQLIALNRPDMFRTFEVWRIAAQDALILHMPEEEFLILNN